ncbi:hypothetical protein MHBO_003708 [Bonamia ostreae]|uniref:Cleavage stimulation factor 50 kDa subunit n=1 Tax=Bonamia ostreae TaxID=126728 RepID=A0ABV2ARX0_9EUKA
MEFSDDTVSLKPVVRTFYDNVAPVNDLDFHPKATLLISCSQDNSIKFFDHEKMIQKKAYNEIVERKNIRSIQFHPSGEYIISAGDNRFIRIINVQNFKTFISRDSLKQHKHPINQVRYNEDGKTYVSCSKDGQIKFWDGLNNICYRTIENAHGGAPVSSIHFSQNSKLLLSCGPDSTARIWDVGTGQEWLKIQGFRNDSYRSNAVFFHSDAFVLCPDKTSNSIFAFDKNTGKKVRQFLGHSKPVKCLSVSQSEPAFLSCRFKN